MLLAESAGRVGPMWQLSWAGPGRAENFENVIGPARPGRYIRKCDAPGRARPRIMKV